MVLWEFVSTVKQALAVGVIPQSVHCRDLSSLLQEVSNSLTLTSVVVTHILWEDEWEGENTQGEEDPKKEADCSGRKMHQQTVKPQSLGVLTLWHNLVKLLIMGEHKW